MANSSLGTYYVQIEASSGGLGKAIESDINGAQIGSSFGGSFLDTVKGMAIGSVIGNLITSGLQMAADGAREIFSQAFDGFADYQQLSGGIEKLYGDAAGRMMELANEAYRTSGMSANRYMENATSFSAALINDLGGDVDAAAEMTDAAMRLISDNANTFGTDMDNLSMAVRNFSRGNYTMLDNLSLGYAGSKEGMEQLIADANEYARSQGLAGDLVIDSFSDQIRALELIQQKQGIAGTTALEAANTVSGSLGMLSASWSNFMVGIASDSADMEVLTQNLVESLGAAASNVIPVVMRIGSAALQAIPSLVSEAFTAIVAAIDEHTGGMASNILAMVEPIIAPFRDQVFPVIQEAWQHVFSAAEKIMPVISSLAQGAMGLLAQAAQFLGWAFEQLRPITNFLVDVFGGALTIALQGVTGVVELLAAGFQAVGDIVGPVIEAILDGFEGLMEDLGPILDTIGGFFVGVGDFIQDPLGSINDFIFGTETAADTTRSASAQIARDSKKGYGAVTDAAKKSATEVTNSAQRMANDSIASYSAIDTSARTRFEAARNSIVSSMSSATGSVKSSASSIQSAIDGIKGRTIDIKAQTNDIGGIANSVKGVLNSIASKKSIEINAYKTGINGVKAVKDLYGGMLSAIRLIAFARGGIVSSPTMAVIGEAGYSEAVVPLSPSGLRPFAAALAEQLDGGSSGVVINVARMEVRKESDIDMIANRLNNMVSRSNGGRL